MSDEETSRPKDPVQVLTEPPKFTNWKEWEDVQVALTPQSHPVPGFLVGRHVPSDEWLFLEHGALTPAQQMAGRELAGVPLRDGVWMSVPLAKDTFEDKLRALKRSAKEAVLGDTPPGVWMTVTEAARRSPGGQKKATDWLWARGLPRSLDGTAFVLTDEWIAALQAAPAAARSGKQSGSKAKKKSGSKAKKKSGSKAKKKSGSKAKKRGE